MQVLEGNLDVKRSDSRCEDDVEDERSTKRVGFNGKRTDRFASKGWLSMGVYVTVMLQAQLEMGEEQSDEYRWDCDGCEGLGRRVPNCCEISTFPGRF